MTRPFHSFETACIIRDLGRHNLSPRMKCVLIALRIFGEQSAAELAATLGARTHSRRSAAGGALLYLHDKGLVTRRRRTDGHYSYKLASSAPVLELAR